MDVAVYLFTGFLEAGKTSLIQETLEDKQFNAGERTLILSCEEGIEEFDFSKFAKPNVFLESIETLSQLNPDKLEALQKKHKAARVMIEYNGMWQNADLYKAMPENWYIYQEIMLADANTFMTYNANMRSLVVDKLQNCEMVVFNRFDAEKTDRTELHKLVRAVSRQTNIAYEHTDHTIEYDDIEDPLPFDLDAPVVEIADRDYAIFYRDMTEDMEKYKGKTLSFVGVAARDPHLPDTDFAIGRHVMTCCANDITYHGMICTGAAPTDFATQDWVRVTGVLDIQYHKLYRQKGPVLKLTAAERVEPLPENEQVATFY